MASILEAAQPEEKAAAHVDLGVRLVYDDRANQVRVTADLSRVPKRVGGASSASTPRTLSHRYPVAA